jgi:hypothetical protein
LLRGEKGLGRVIISYNAKHFDIYVIAEGSSGFVLVNPLGKVVAKLSSSWRYWRNLSAPGTTSCSGSTTC